MLSSFESCTYAVRLRLRVARSVLLVLGNTAMTWLWLARSDVTLGAVKN